MEMAVGFVVACLLPCRKFFDHVGEQIKSGSLVTLVSRRNGSKSTASGEARKSSETHQSYQEKKQHVEPVDLEIGRIMTSKELQIDELLRDETCQFQRTRLILLVCAGGLAEERITSSALPS